MATLRIRSLSDRTRIKGTRFEVRHYTGAIRINAHDRHGIAPEVGTDRTRSISAGRKQSRKQGVNGCRAYNCRTRRYRSRRYCWRCFRSRWYCWRLCRSSRLMCMLVTHIFLSLITIGLDTGGKGSGARPETDNIDPDTAPTPRDQNDLSRSVG